MQSINDELLLSIMKFYNNNEDSKPVIETIFKDILDKYNFDENKIKEAFDFVVKNDDGQGFMNNNNMFIVSSNQENAIFMKPFVSKEKPYVYFYNVGQKNPFLKIKQQMNNGILSYNVETSSNPELLTSNKNFADKNDPYFCMVDKFEILDSTIYEHKNLTMKTQKYHGKNQTAFVFDKYINFYEFLNSTIFKPQQIQNVSDESILNVMQNFYNVIEKFMVTDYEMSLQDLVKVTDCVINDNYNIQEFNKNKIIEAKNFADTFCSIMPSSGECPYSVDIDISGHKNISNAKITRNFKCSNIEFYDKNGEVLSRYIICLTQSGFTVFRSICNEQAKQKTYIPTFTINASDNELKFSSLSEAVMEYKLNNFIDISILFQKDGSIIYTSNDYYLKCLNKNKLNVNEVANNYNMLSK